MLAVYSNKTCLKQNLRKSDIYFYRRSTGMKIMLVLTGVVLLITFCVFSTSDMVQAEEVLGTGTAALLGGDLTDPENDGAPDADEGYNAIFSANEEPGFGGGEFSFNVFDNLLGGGNAKWCCGVEVAFRRKVCT